MSTDSATPRTDKQLWTSVDLASGSTHGSLNIVSADFARELEMELSKVRRDKATLIQAVDMWKRQWLETQDAHAAAIAALESELALARKERDEALEKNTKLRKILAHIDGMTVIKAKEDVGYGVQVKAASGDAMPELEPKEALASRLMDVWIADKGRKIPWATAVKIAAIVTRQGDAERDRLLRMNDESGECGSCGRSDAAIACLREVRGLIEPWAGGYGDGSLGKAVQLIDKALS